MHQSILVMVLIAMLVFVENRPATTGFTYAFGYTKYSIDNKMNYVENEI